MLRQDLLEAGEATALVGAIIWLAQNILETLQPGELDAWLHQVGLAGAIGKLKSEIHSIETVVSGDKGRVVGNKPLAVSLAHVKELMDDADNVMHELDYFRLQEDQVQGVMTAPDIGPEGMAGGGAEQVDASATNTSGMLAPATEPKGIVGDRDRDGAEQADPSANNTGTLNNSGRKNRSEVWDNFHLVQSVNSEPAKAKCNHCARELAWGNGTSALHKHLKSCNKKRSAIEETPNRACAGNNVQSGATILTNDSDSTKRMRIEYSVANITHQVKEVMISPPIGPEGMVGDGAEHVDASANTAGISDTNGRKNRCKERDNFDITPAVNGEPARAKCIDCGTQVVFSHGTSVLRKHRNSASCKKKRAAIEEVPNCPSADSSVQNCAIILNNADSEGTKRMRTESNVAAATHPWYKANFLKRINKIVLELGSIRGYVIKYLKDSVACFDQYQSNNTLDSGKVYGRHEKNDIVPMIKAAKSDSLKISSYYQLPYYLQRCLLFCSIFPNGYLFHIDELVNMWISSRFVKSAEIGRGYFNDLVKSSFFEEVSETDYVVCGIMHEFARLISKTEFATIDGLECKEVLPTVRHISILTDSVYHKDEQVFVLRNMEFEEKLQSLVSSVKRLRMLILIGNYDPLFLWSFQTFMCKSVNCTHLRYLKLQNKGSSAALSISLSKFYHLEVLDVGQSVSNDGTSDLVNMRNLVLSKGACGACCPAWIACLQTIHLEDCKGQEMLPSLESLSCLAKLKLRNMPEVTELSIPSLEELVLIDMPYLGTCISKSVMELNSRLTVLEIRGCGLLMAPFFESYEEIRIEQKLWLSNVGKLTIHDSPNLMVSYPLPPSSNFCKLSIRNISKFAKMEGSSNGEMEIKTSDTVTPGDKILSFHNLKTITGLEIMGCENLSPISLEDLRQLVCLKRLEIKKFPKFFSSDVPSTHTHEDMADTDFDALLSLEFLSIDDCGITGKWLSLILQHVRSLEELHLKNCPHITVMLIEGKENSLPNLTSAPRASSRKNSDFPKKKGKNPDFPKKKLKNPDGASTKSFSDKLLRIPSNLLPSLKKMSVEYCGLKFQGSRKSFSEFTSLEELRIVHCPQLIPSLVHGGKANGRWLLPCSLGVLDIRDANLRTLQPYFPGNLTRLRVLQVSQSRKDRFEMSESESDSGEDLFEVSDSVDEMDDLLILNLQSCTALEKLTIRYCNCLGAVEGVRSLRGLRYLEVYGCPRLDHLFMQDFALCTRLERLGIGEPTFLNTPFCEHLTSLQCLQLEGGGFDDFFGGKKLASEEEAALQHLTSLQELRFAGYHVLSDLPACLHSFPSLKRFGIVKCRAISKLPEGGLPPSLEELELYKCSKELTEQCRKLATSKLKVIIDDKYVN